MSALKSLIASFGKCNIRNYIQVLDRPQCVRNIFTHPHNTSPHLTSSSVQNVATSVLHPEISRLNSLSSVNYLQVRNSMYSCYMWPESENRRFERNSGQKGELMNYLARHHRHLNPIPKKKRRNPLGEEGKPYAKGVILKLGVKKPRKPNSGNRKCVFVRLSTGKEAWSYIPKEGNNLQEHNVVLCHPQRLRDTPGVKLRCVRGAYDLPHVIKKNK